MFVCLRLMLYVSLVMLASTNLASAKYRLIAYNL
jgi:hypothetical protein